MIKSILSAALCTLALAAHSQFTGISLYPHANSDAYLSSGKPCVNPSNSNAGFVMAGYVPAICCPGNIVFIDKVDDDGSAGGPNWFQNAYACSTGGTSCSALNAELNCYGVSIVETHVPASASPVVPAPLWYAIATAFDSGVIFSGLDNTGAVTTSAFYPFPAGATQPTKPLITESALSPGTFYIAGSYLSGSIRYLYTMRVDAAGTILWSQNYDLGNSTSMTPTAIIENPTAFAGATLELIVVGFYDGGTGIIDAFFINIDDASNGTTFAMTSFGTPNSNDEFHSIDYAPTGGGYIVGGYTDAAAPTWGNAWMVLMDPSNIPIPFWAKIIQSSSDPNAGPVVGVVERVSSTYGNTAEYYGTLPSTAGMMVLKLDASGAAFFQLGNPNNEFTYDATAHGNPSIPAGISYDNIAGSTREGIHIYGYDWAPGGAAVEYMLVQGCFNGVAGAMGCQQNQTTLSSIINGVDFFNGSQPSNTAGLNNCANFNFSGSIVNYGVASFCAASSLPAGGDNSRSSGITSIAKNMATEEGLRLQPNPASDMVEISYPTGGPVSVSLYNSLGQLVHNSYNDGRGKAITIDLAALNLASGIYVVKASANGTVYQQKLIYNK